MAFRVTCVCLGNICRSPMAEAVLRQRFAAAGLAERVHVDSAGTSGWHVGADADARARATLAAGGYDLAHAARAFDPEWLEHSDLILAMDRDNWDALVELADRHGVPDDHIALLRSFDPTAGAGAEVPDPYYGGPDGFRDVLAMIERAAAGIVDHVAAQLDAAPPPA